LQRIKEKIFFLLLIGLGLAPGLSVFAQKIQWVKQVGGKGTAIKPYNIFSEDEDKQILLF